MTNPANYEAFRNVAVDVFKAQNLAAIQSLKKFLAALPSPSYIRRALLEAIEQLAEEDPVVCRWVVQHHRALQPELDLVLIAQSMVQQRLQNQGLTLNQDFGFTAEGQLQASDAIKALLLEERSVLEEMSAVDRLLLEEILLI